VQAKELPLETVTLEQLIGSNLARIGRVGGAPSQKVRLIVRGDVRNISLRKKAISNRLFRVVYVFGNDDRQD